MRVRISVLVVGAVCAIAFGCDDQGSSTGEPTSGDMSDTPATTDDADTTRSSEAASPSPEDPELTESAALDTSVTAVVARAREALAHETTVRRLSWLNDREMVTISETIGQGINVRERRFKEEGCPEDPEGICPFFDHVLIGDTIYVYQGDGAWSSAPMPETTRNENEDAFLGLDGVLTSMLDLERVRSDGSVVRGYITDSTIEVVATFDDEGRPIEYQVMTPVPVTLQWNYGVDVTPIQPPL